MELKRKVKEWYRGKYISPEERNKKINGPFYVLIGSYEKTKSAKLAEILFKFWVNHWKWIVASIIGLIALIK